MKKHMVSICYCLMCGLLAINNNSFANQKTIDGNDADIHNIKTRQVRIDPVSDLQKFRAFFLNRFPKVPLEEFANGVYALSINAEIWDILEFPPYEIAIDDGEDIFNTPFRNGKTFSSCFENNGIGIKSNYPYFNQQSKEVHTLELEINKCLTKNGEKPFKYGKGEISSVSAYMASTTRGQEININIPDNPRALAAYEKGRTFFYARRGQLNLSCAHCHVDNSGNKIRADLLGPALGQMSHFPVYRAKWGGMGTVHRRFVGCNKQVRAQPFALQGPEYRNLEYFLTFMSNGIAWNGPGYRK